MSSAPRVVSLADSSILRPDGRKNKPVVLASKMISLGHVTRQEEPKKVPEVVARRMMAWPGGKITSNKDTALAKFVLKLREKSARELTTAQRGILDSWKQRSDGESLLAAAMADNEEIGMNQYGNRNKGEGRRGRGGKRKNNRDNKNKGGGGGGGGNRTTLAGGAAASGRKERSNRGGTMDGALGSNRGGALNSSLGKRKAKGGGGVGNTAAASAGQKNKKSRATPQSQQSEGAHVQLAKGLSASR